MVSPSPLMKNCWLDSSKASASSMPGGVFRRAFFIESLEFEVDDSADPDTIHGFEIF